MTALAPGGALQTSRPELTTNPKTTGQASFHPDVLAYACEHGITRPRTIACLQREYDRALADRIADEDWTPALTRIVGHSGSRPVDAQADRVAARISRRNP